MVTVNNRREIVTAKDESASNQPRNAVDLSTFENSWYKPGSTAKRLAWYLCNALFIKTYIPYPSSLKKCLLKMFGAKIGSGLILKPNVNIKYPWFLEVGDNVWIGEGVWLDNLAHVKIGNNVCISQGALLLTGNHDYNSASFDLMVRPITIEDGAWVGAKSLVCPGVTLGSHAVLSVGSVATKNIDAFTICAGNPAQVVRDRRIG